MKREFLQNFKVNEQPLPKEIIDAIMDENGRDIEATKRPCYDYGALDSSVGPEGSRVWGARASTASAASAFAPSL